MKDLAQEFLTASQRLGDAMLADLQAKDPLLAQAVAVAVANGERLMLSFTLGEQPVIELLTHSDYRTVRRVCSIPLRGGHGTLN